MLQAIRNNAQGVFVWVIVGLIIVSFALFGLGSYLSGASKVVAASVNGVEISSTALTRAYQRYQERLRSMLGEQYRPEMFATVQVKKEVLQGLITQEVLNQSLTEQGYSASAQQVFAKIKQYEAFQDDGVFSSKRYKEVLSIQGINGEAFENDLSRDIAASQLRTAISASAFLTEKEKNTLAQLENQMRKMGYFDISTRPYRKLIKITDADINSYYEKNAQLFLTDEKVQIEYIELNMDAIAAQQDVTEEMIQQQYESSSDNYMANDDAAVKKTMASLRKQIINGADFATLAKKHSQDKGSAKQGGDLGYVTRGIEEKFDQVVFGLKKGEVSSIIKSKNGFQLIQLDDIRKGDPEERKVRHILIKPERKLRPLHEVRAEIKKELQYHLAGKVFFDDTDQMNNLSYESSDSLEPVAEALAVKIKTGPLMSHRGGTGLFANPKILTAAFSDDVLKQGRNSELLELSDSHVVVLRVKEHKPASVLALSIVKSQIKDNLLQMKAGEKSQKVTSDILARMKNNETIQAIEKRYPEIKWIKSNWIKRKAEKNSNLPDIVRQHTFSMAKPIKKTSWSKVALSAGNQAVIGLFNVETSTDGEADITKITQVLGSSDYDSYVKYLESQADISISENALDADTNQ